MKYKVLEDWCDKHDLEEADAFLDCPLYNPEWFNCDECKFHKQKYIQVDTGRFGMPQNVRGK